MGSFKQSLFLAIFCLVLIHELEIHNGKQMAASAQNIDCKAKCDYRCSKTSRQKMCIRACNTCCGRCSCVPPGTSGNHEVCPCYASMTTHGGRKKCP